MFGEERGERKLAKRMTEARADHPLSRKALLRIETNQRALSLDEACAFADILPAPLASLLAPPEGAVVALTDVQDVPNGESMRHWLITGSPEFKWPAEPKEEHKEQLDEILMHNVVAYAQILVDAVRAKDKAGGNEALAAIDRAYERYHKALVAIEERKGRTDC
jgi:hypothetical protein